MPRTNEDTLVTRFMFIEGGIFKELNVKKEERKVRKIIDNLDAIKQLRKTQVKIKKALFIFVALFLMNLLSGCQQP